jgi:transcriptional regulator with XRE-family HTH domain
MHVSAEEEAWGQELQLAFGRRVRELRVKAGLSQEDFHRKTGINRTWIGHVENGRRNVRVEGIVAIAEGLGVDPGDLVGGLPSPPPRRSQINDTVTGSETDEN